MGLLDRDGLVEKLADLRALSPGIRFGQLLANLGLLVQDRTGGSLWEVEDAELIAAIEQHRLDLQRRAPPPDA